MQCYTLPCKYVCSIIHYTSSMENTTKFYFSIFRKFTTEKSIQTFTLQAKRKYSNMPDIRNQEATLLLAIDYTIKTPFFFLGEILTFLTLLIV